jgi:hypothetical protein
VRDARLVLVGAAWTAGVIVLVATVGIVWHAMP